MSLLLLVLALLALAGAGLLWRADKRKAARAGKAEQAPKPPREPRSRGRNREKGRKTRRDWAEANGFTFARSDEFLTDEWTRGAASSGVLVKDVFSGVRFGHDTRIANIADTTVVAMGTGMASDVVVDMRRDIVGTVEDLVEVATLEGFTVFASEAGPVERMLDIRVTTALELLPEQVSAVWFETEWVLAQLDGEDPEWDALLAPLALLADAARTLPPHTWPRLEITGPTREMGEPEEPVSAAIIGEERAAHPTVVRPEEPLVMPTRLTGGVRGWLEERGVGEDDVDAIATGEAAPHPNDGTRMTRRQTPPSIFGD